MKAISFPSHRPLQVLASVCLGAFALNALENPAHAAPFKSKKGYSLTVPARWKIDQKGTMGTDVMLLAPAVNGFASNLNVMVAPVPANATLEQLKPQIVPTYSKMFTDFKLQKQTFVPFAGTRALVTDATYKLGSPARAIHMSQTIALRNRKAFIITSTTSVAALKTYQPAFQSILKSVRLTP